MIRKQARKKVAGLDMPTTKYIPKKSPPEHKSSGARDDYRDKPAIQTPHRQKYTMNVFYRPSDCDVQTLRRMLNLFFVKILDKIYCNVFCISTFLHHDKLTALPSIFNPNSAPISQNRKNLIINLCCKIILPILNALLHSLKIMNKITFIKFMIKVFMSE